MNDSTTMPLVSVVMPVYNGARYLREAIDSILSQTYKKFELIIINDGSKDSSEAIIKSYSDPRILYLINENNSGICITLNKGLDAAKGKYIARMDCDDISAPERLQKQVEIMESHPNVGIVGSDIITFGEGIRDQYFEFVHDRDQCKAGVLFNSPFAHPSVMIRIDVLRNHGLYYDDQYRGREDYEMWYKMSKFCDFVNLSQPLLRYRIHKAQITQNRTLEDEVKADSFIRMRFSIYDFTESEMKAVVFYCLMQWDAITNDVFQHLFTALQKVIKHPTSHTTHSYHKAMQITLSKALVFAMRESSFIKLKKPVAYTKALLDGIMPFDWYLKFMYHAILK